MLLPGVRAVLLGETDLEKKIETVRRIASYRQSALPRYATLRYLVFLSGRLFWQKCSMLGVGCHL